MSWKPEVDGIEQRRQLALEHGGSEAVAKQHAKGSLTVRERISGVSDPGSFREQGSIAGSSETDESGKLVSFRPANFVLGTARVDGRPCVVGGEDYTLRGGTMSPAGLRKAGYADQLAARLRVPLIRFLEAGGASIAGTTEVRGRSGYDATAVGGGGRGQASNLATVPVVCAAMGPVAGQPAARLVVSHLSIMTRHNAQVLVGGPALVERALGKPITKEELGGPQVHLRSGVVDNLAEDEEDAFRQIRTFLSYLPTNVWQSPPVAECDDPSSRREEELIAIIPRARRQAYKMRRLIELVIDRGSFFEMGRQFGPSEITGLARLNGYPIGLFANDPMVYAGAMTTAAAHKVRRFLDMCDTFHLPIVSLADEPGYMIGLEAERAATIRHGTTVMFAAQQSSVPWATLLVRKNFGVAAGVHYGPGGLVLAWPSAEAGALPVEGGVAIAYRREIAAAPDPDARRRELEEELAAQQSAFPRAESFGVHEMIDPRDTRPVLCDWVESVQTSLDTLRGPRSYSIRP